MAKSATYYNQDDFNKYKTAQGKCVPPRYNILMAAYHIQVLFDAKKFTYGFFGGLPMLCLGYKREMPDLHIAYNDKDFERLKAKLGSDRRVRLPTGMNPLMPFKILVWTGPDYKDQGCTVNASIELDLVPSGSCGTPLAGTLSRNLVLLGLQTASGAKMIFKSLNMQYQLTALLSYCKARDLLWDPRKDILYLCKNECEEVKRSRTQLNVKDTKELFLGTSFFSRLSSEDQRLCYRTLLDTEPPPTMSVTPPAAEVSSRPAEKSEEPKDDSRLPRSRYRHINGQRNSSSSSSNSGLPNQSPTPATRLRPIEQSQDTTQLSKIQGVQSVLSGKPQTVSASTAASRARKSMPDLLAVQDASNKAARRSMGQSELKGSPHQKHPLGQQVLGSPKHIQASSNLVYGGSFRPAHVRQGNETASADRSYSQGQETLASCAGSFRQDLTGTPVPGLQSQKGSLHVVSPEGVESPPPQYFEESSTSTRGRLHLVGPEGVYGAPRDSRESSQPQNQHSRHQSAPPPQTQSSFVFELDAAEAPKTTFVAELPADSIAPSPVKLQTVRPHEPSQASTRPTNSRTQSDPLEVESLPASLLIGGSGAQTHRQSLSQPDLSDDGAVGLLTRQTNAYRYSSYAYLQSSGAKSRSTSMEQNEAPSYKPYRPFVAPDELNRNDSVSSVYSPRHKRDASDDSTASHDSSKLAREYQDLLGTSKGYGSD